MLDKSAIIAQTPSRPVISQYGTVHQLPTGYSDRLYNGVSTENGKNRAVRNFVEF